MIRKYGLYAAWVLAMLATFGSLYLNEVQSLPACHLCWYQKICMYPLAPIIGLAAWRGNLGIAVYLLPQTIIGFVLALFQVLIQSFSIRGFFPIEFCTPGPDCAETIAFGIESLTLPILSAIAFFFINVLLFILDHIHKKSGITQGTII
jgi:disulfide bond formation protein DsbB